MRTRLPTCWSSRMAYWSRRFCIEWLYHERISTATLKSTLCRREGPNTATRVIEPASVTFKFENPGADNQIGI
jgi:hypothetical protein